MGVHGLWQLLQPAGQPVTLESLEGKVLAVDVSIWLHQTMKGMRDKDGNPLPNAHLQGLFSRICKLMFYRIKPVFVFDGGVPVLKKQTMAARRERKAEAERESNEISQKLLLNLIKSHAVRQTLGDMGSGNRHVPGIRKGRNQPDSDMFELAPLAESEEIGLTLNAEEWERDFELQENWIKEGLAAVSDTHPDSEEFRSLPMEIQHEVLNELKEQKKYHSLSRLTNMPEDSTDFSQYQLEKLMKQSKLTNRIEEVRKRMASKTSEDIAFTLGDEYRGDEVEARRIISEDASHYVLIKGLTKKMQDQEADRYEIINRVKLEKVEEDVGSDDSHGLVKDTHFVSKEKGQSSDSDSEIETVMARKLNRKRHQKSKLSQSAMKTENSKVSGVHKKSKQIVSSDDDDVIISSRGKHHQTDVSYSSEDEGFIEVTVDPSAAAEDDLFPASIFQTNFDSNKENSSSENSKHRQQKANHAGSEVKQTKYSSLCGDKVQPAITTKDPDRARDSGDITWSNTDWGKKKEEILRPSSETDDVALKRKNILNEILSQLEEKKKHLIDSQADIHDDMMESFEESCTGGGFIMGGSSNDKEESSAMMDESGSSATMVFEPEIQFSDNVQQESSRSLSNNLDETNSMSESDDDLKIAIELSLQTAKNENKKISMTAVGSLEDTVSIREINLNSSLGTSKNLELPEVNEQNPTKILSDSDSDIDDFVEVKSDLPFMQNSNIVTKNNESAEYNKTNLNENKRDTQSESSDSPEISSKVSKCSIKDLSSEHYHHQWTTAQSQSTTETLETPLKTLPNQLQPDDYEIDHERIFQVANEEELEDARAMLESERSALMSERGKQVRLATSITEQTNLEAQELLRLFGIPYIISPIEAEAQCAYLDITNQTHGTITDDSDIWLFGGCRVYKNFFNQSKHVEFFTCGSIHNHFGLSRQQLINIAVLCGSDYTEGIPGVGPVRALEIMAEFPGDGLEGLCLFRKWWDKAKLQTVPVAESKVRARLKDLKVIPGFPSQTVVDAYLHPQVDDSTEKFSWGTPDLVMLREFAKYKFGWSKEKSDQSLLPMMKQFSKKESQGRMHTYFQPHHFIQTSKIKSERLKKALALVKNPKQTSHQENEAEQSVDSNSHVEVEKMVDSGNKDKKSKNKKIAVNNKDSTTQTIRAPQTQQVGKISKKKTIDNNAMKKTMNDKPAENEMVFVKDGDMEKEVIKVEDPEREVMEVEIEREKVKVEDIETEKFTTGEIIKRNIKQVGKKKREEKHKKQVSCAGVEDIDKSSTLDQLRRLEFVNKQKVAKKKKVNHGLQEMDNSSDVVKKARISQAESRRGKGGSRTGGDLYDRGRGKMLISLDHKERSRGQNLGLRKGGSRIGRGIVHLSESSTSEDDNDESTENESHICKPTTTQVRQRQSSKHKQSSVAWKDIKGVSTQIKIPQPKDIVETPVSYRENLPSVTVEPGHNSLDSETAASGSQNIAHYSTSGKKNCQQSLNTDQTTVKVPYLMSSKLTGSKQDDMTTQNKDCNENREVDIDISKADVSVINRQILPSTLTYLNHRSREDQVLLQQLKGKRTVTMNAVERRLEESERRSRVEKQKTEGIKQATGETMSFGDILGGLDATVTINIQNKGKKIQTYKKSSGDASHTDNTRQVKTFQDRNQFGKVLIRSSSKEELNEINFKKSNWQANNSGSGSNYLVTVSSSYDEKETVTQKEHQNLKDEPLIKQKKSVEKIIFNSGNKDFEWNDRASSRQINMSVQNESTFKSKRSKVFDISIDEIGDYSSDFSDSGVTDLKKMRFLKQLEHLGDSKTVKGHGPLPSQFAGQVTRGKALAGKGKGKGKNRNNLEDVSGHRLQSKISDSEILEYATVTAEDLGSDFSDCDI